MTTREVTAAVGAVSVPIQVILGETALSVADLSALTEGTVLQLNRLAVQPVVVLAAGQEIAWAEVVVIDETFGVRITRMLGEYNPLAEEKV